MKKKFIFFVFFFAVLLSETVAQYSSFKNKLNLVGFAGLVDRQSFDQTGYYYGLYGDLMLLRSKDEKFSLGEYAVVSRSDSYYNNQQSIQRNLEYGGGINFGYYEPEFSRTSHSFIGLSLGLIQGKEKQDVSVEDGLYESWQEDLFLSSSLNLNLMKFGPMYHWFTRSQIQLSWKEPIKSSRVAYWNGQPSSGAKVWDKTYVEVLAKQNVYKNYLSRRSDLCYSPKLVGFYSHSQGDSRSFYGLGAELALFREYHDDLLSLGAIYKVSRNFSDNYLMVSLKINFSQLGR